MLTLPLLQALLLIQAGCVRLQMYTGELALLDIMWTAIAVFGLVLMTQ